MPAFGKQAEFENALAAAEQQLATDEDPAETQKYIEHLRMCLRTLRRDAPTSVEEVKEQRAGIQREIAALRQQL